MINRATEIDAIIGYVDDNTALTDGGDFVARDDITDGGLDTDPEELDYSGADEEADSQDAYIPGPIETFIDKYKGRISPHGQVTDQETARVNNQRPVYIPGPIETFIDKYKDRIGPHRQVSDEDACIDNNIPYEDLLAEQAASIKAMQDLDTFVAGSIVKTRKIK